MRDRHIVAVDIYLERRKSRSYVGRLKKENDKFIFSYDNTYLYKDNSIPIGPDLPLTKNEFTSNTLFTSFEDRLPSKRNPAYAEYCKMVNISPDEKDIFVLLSTIGQKGPSSFILAPVYYVKFDSLDALKFRQKLELSIRDFCDLFDFSYSTIHRLEVNKGASKEALKRIEIYTLFPQAAINEVKRNCYKINSDAVKKVIRILNKEHKDKSKSQ